MRRVSEDSHLRGNNFPPIGWQLLQQAESNEVGWVVATCILFFFRPNSPSSSTTFAKVFLNYLEELCFRSQCQQLLFELLVLSQQPLFVFGYHPSQCLLRHSLHVPFLSYFLSTSYYGQKKAEAKIEQNYLEVFLEKTVFEWAVQSMCRIRASHQSISIPSRALSSFSPVHFTNNITNTCIRCRLAQCHSGTRAPIES